MLPPNCSAAVIKMSKHIQIPHNKGSKREQEEKEETPAPNINRSRALKWMVIAKKWSQPPKSLFIVFPFSYLFGQVNWKRLRYKRRSQQAELDRRAASITQNPQVISVVNFIALQLLLSFRSSNTLLSYLYGHMYTQHH